MKSYEVTHTQRALTEEERVFAEQHHDMIYKYMNYHSLDEAEWYDILVIPYLNAVKKYHTYEKMRSLNFDQVFFRTLDNARSNYFRAMVTQKRKPEHGIISYELVVGWEQTEENTIADENSITTGLTNIFRDPLEKQVIDKIVFQKMMKEFGTGREREIFGMLAEGYRKSEIKRKLNMKTPYFNEIMEDMCGIISRYLDEYYN